MAGLVETRKDGQRVLYRARDSHVRNLIAEALSHVDHETPGVPGHSDRGGDGQRPAEGPW
jgi:DNA-binding transcriptional ArsR family regulator